MSIPEQYTYRPASEGAYRPASGEWAPTDGTYAPPPDGWPPADQWTQYYQPPQPPQRRRNGKVVAAVGGGLAALLIAAGGGFAAGWSLHPAATSSSSSTALPFNPGTGSGTGNGAQSGGGFGNGGTGNGSTGNGSTGNGSTGNGSTSTSGTGATAAQVSAVAAKVDPALVDIDTVLGAENGEAAGTGIVLTSDGVILTNNHVVAGATSITVTDIGNQKSYRAAVIGYDRSDDVAVLQLSGASGLTTASLSTATVKAGDSVVAIGNAGGTGGTPSAVGGSITATDQSITASDESSGASEQLTGLLETDANIQAGDSGGPLLTTSGQVIGMDTAASAGFQYQQQQSSGGDGFAIPIAHATTIADQIRGGQSSSKVHLGETAYLGVEVTSSATRGQQSSGGPTILGVVSGSPADSAGLTRGDVITSVAGTSVADATALTNVLDRHHPGDKVKVAWTDVSGQSHSGTLTLTTGPVG